MQADRSPRPAGGQVQRLAPAILVAGRVEEPWVFPSIAAGWTRASIPSPKGFRATSVSPRASIANDPFSGLLGAVHETGHAMYDLGLPLTMARSAGGPRPRPGAGGEPVAAVRDEFVPQPGIRRSTSSRCSKSISRSVVQNGVKSNLYRHLTRVKRSLIRMDADELTYPVHIMLRYELERKILEGGLSIADLPEAWNANLEQRLNIRPSNDLEGCLQDIHWAVGHFGYFPSYALGAVIAGQLNEALRAERPSLDQEIAAGQFGGVMEWLRDNVHGVGARLPVQELMKQATGKPLTAAAYIRYLESKYLEAPP